MNGKKLIGMFLVLVILGGISIVQNRCSHKRTVAGNAEKQALLEQVDLNQVDLVEVQSGSNKVSLVKKEAKWVVKSLYDYPVDFPAFVKAIRAVSEVELEEPVRTAHVDPDEFGFVPNSKVITIKINGKTQEQVTIGAERKPSEYVRRSNQCFIKKMGSDEIYLVHDVFHPFRVNPEDWVEKQLINVMPNNVVEASNGALTLKVDNADWVLSDLDKETEKMKTSEANSFRSVLRSLYFSSVVDPATSDEELGFTTNTVVYSALLDSGISYTLTLGAEIGGNRAVRLSANYTTTSPPQKPEEDDEDALKQYEERLKQYNDHVSQGMKEAASFNKEHQPWTYFISNSKLDSVDLDRPELVEEKVKETAEQ